MIEKYNDLIETIVADFNRKLCREEGKEEEDINYEIIDYKGVNQGPILIWDSYLNLDDILINAQHNFTAKSLITYSVADLDAHMEGKTLNTNYYNYTMYNKELNRINQ